MNEQEYKIKGWVARDSDGSLTLCKVKPLRWNNDCWVGAEEYFPLSRTLFPELTFESEPIEVELTIKKI